MKVADFSVVDLFCGIGGLTHGFVKEKFKVDAGIDSDQTCEYAFEENNNGAEFFHDDITAMSGEDLIRKYTQNKRKILVGCAPCQPFSIYKKGTNKVDKKSKDEKWKLLYSFSNLIDEVEPDIVSMENVPLLLSFNRGKVFQDFVDRLKKRGYYVTYYLVNAQDYGVPQRRKRLILFASKFGEITLIEKTILNGNFVTVRDAIGHLPEVTDGVAHQDDQLHLARKLTPINKKRIQSSKPGGTWQDWDSSLWLECHKKESGKNFKSVYGRMKWEDVAPTMTTYCVGLSNGRFGHPEQDRAITLREAALIQSFPEDYKFSSPVKELPIAVLARQIGNAVPVELGVAIARSIKNHIETIESN